MPETKKPPFRADHVGSLLRPRELREARHQHQLGSLSRESLREVEDRCIREIVAMQEDVGLSGMTDGEYRRTFFHIDFLEQLEGVAVRGGIAAKFHSAKGDVDFSPPRLEVVGPLVHTHDIQREDFQFLRSVTTRVPKVCIPSPTMVHFRGGRGGISAAAYPDLEVFFDDLARCFREEIASLVAAGCRYLQLDDTNLAYLCDPVLRQGAIERGDDPNELPRTYARLINAAIRDRPEDMAVCIHLCRGNFRSAWVAEGGYDPVAEVLFNEIAVDGFFLEYDDHRSGDFSPLRFVPPGKTVVLGLVSSKVGELEPRELLERRIDEASKYVAVDQLCLSPQCGFSSTVEGNEISESDQAAKLRRVVETAERVWGRP